MPTEIISHFKEKPKNKIAWQAMWLGLSTVLISPTLGIFAAVIRPMIDKAGNGNTGATFGFILMIALLILAVTALTTCIRAFKKGEHSWVLWVGFVPAILTAATLVLMVVGEFVFPH
jgi:hypothetical protein